MKSPEKFVESFAALAAAGIAAVAALAVAVPAAAQTAPQTAKASMVNAKGEPVGEATLTQTPRGVLIRLSMSGLAAERAFHIHQTGKCEPPFTSAGGHFNPENRKHGLMQAEGQHAGDMPNLHVGADGKITVEALNTGVTLEKGKPNSLLREGGTALIVHEGKDDYRTDPTGDAGGRAACGVITE
ncbi:superoxide dismutase family protein [Alsobacter sp. SYSU M60028]|uniref:Superoxide dismutase [Cu-Zn] n=1 Tax=Alsobacter ponti TaxID=2962936 RepID=A0ABT1LBG6_9HYPH|nr:superoxide dismutase family protein [Alsobacter ponti]MCP8938794.1 superoxide dismutase family protein [Alsobacter ponti]